MARKRHPRLFIGTSGWSYPHWRGTFYPEGLAQRRWFEHYAQRFNTVEINYSFYHLPAPATAAGWAAAAPPGFLYALKASRYISHIKRLKGCKRDFARFLKTVAPLKDHLGPVLLQLPPHWQADDARLAAFLDHVPPHIALAVEFRDESWYSPEIRGLLARHHIALCRHDHADGPCLYRGPGWDTGTFHYLRLHGTARSPTGNYGARSLSRLAAEIATLLESGKPVFCYFNNDAHGNAPRNALSLARRIAHLI